MSKVKSPGEMDQASTEASILKEIERDEELEALPQHPDNFNIRKGYPLPEGFINQPLGDPGHFCIDPAGCYQPSWFQIMIESIHDKEIDPVVFPLSTHYSIYRGNWCDAPPEIRESLISAVEEHHEMNPKPGDIKLGGPETEHKVTLRRRFIWSAIPSAQARK